MLISIIILVLGFVLLIYGANWLVDGASALALKLGVSALVVGLTIVAFGTSTPELIVSVFSSAQGANDLAIGNVIGSNISNLLLILGLCAIIRPLLVKKSTIWKEIPFALLAVILVGVLANDFFIDHMNYQTISRIDGLVFLSLFVIFIYYTFSIKNSSLEIPTTVKQTPTWKGLLMIILGLAGLILGGKFVVDNAIIIATALGASEAFIGLTVVAVGTSLPELVTSVVAVYKKNTDIAIGNIIGSNIFNVFLVLGLSSVIRPLQLSPALNFDILFIIAATIIFFIFLFIGEKYTLKRWQGIIFVLSYFSYIGFLIYRG